jgi:inorganic pyrophosphatase
MAHKSVNATHYEYIPAFTSRKHRRQHVANAIVETPMGSCKKYALEPALGIIAFHSELPEDLEWPYDYGFIPQTLAPDGDGVDVLVINKGGLFSGCLIAVRVIGVVREHKDGVQDDRTVAVPLPSRGAPLPTDAYYDISDLPAPELERIKKFLTEYSELQGHDVRIAGVAGAADAIDVIKNGIKRFKKRRP